MNNVFIRISVALCAFAFCRPSHACYMDPVQVQNACPDQGAVFEGAYPECPAAPGYSCVKCRFNHPTPENPDEHWFGYSGVNVICDTAPAPPPIALVTQPYSRSVCFKGSVIEADIAAVRESIPLAGTSFSLNYSSARAKGRVADYKKTIRVIPGNCGTAIATRTIKIEIAGRTFSTTYSCSNNLEADFIWDGLDSSSSLVVGAARMQMTSIDAYSDSRIVVPQVKHSTIGTFNAKALGLGGWTLSAYHFYDEVLGTVFLGNGATLKADRSAGYQATSADGQELYLFDLNGRHLFTKNALKGTTKYSFIHDSSGRLTSIVDSFSNTTTLSYNSAGALVAITGPYGHVTTIAVGSDGNISSVVNQNSESFGMTYYSGDLIHTYTKPNGVTSTMTYDAEGKLIFDASSAGSSTSISLLGFDQSYAVGVGTAEGIGTTYTINDSTPYTRVQNGPGNLTQTTSVVQDAGGLGNLIGTDVRGFSYYQNYASDPRISYLRYLNYEQTSTPLLNRTVQVSRSATLSDANDIFSVVDSTETQVLNSNKTMTLFYLASNSKYTRTSPVGRKQYVQIDSYERPTSMQFATYTPTTIAYDTRGRVQTVSQGTTRTTTLSYDASGNLQTITNPLSQVKTFGYDSVGRLTSETLPDLRVISYSYDANGNLASVTPPGGLAHAFVSNGFDLLEYYIAPAISFLGVEIKTEKFVSKARELYRQSLLWLVEVFSGWLPGAAKNISRLTVNLETQYAYNNDRQLTSITRPDGSIATFAYNTTTGRLEGVTTPAGSFVIAQNSYVDHVDSIVSPDGVTQAYIYDGPFLASSTSSGTTSGAVYLTYNNEFQLASTKVNTAAVVNYAYDNDGLMTTAGNQSITRNATTGFATKATLSNVSENYTYSTAYGELASIQGKYSTATNIYTTTLTRDDLARVTQKVETVGAGTANTFVYSFDLAGRLTTVTKNGAAYSSYVYDANSNRTSTTRGGVTTLATYDEQDRIVTFGTKTYTHNDAGELTQVSDAATTPAGVTSYTYDVFGNLKSVTLPTGVAISYLLDGQNRRVGRKVGSTINKQFVWFDSLRIAGELNGSGVLQSQFIYGLKGNVPDYIIKGSTRYKVMTDHLGSVVAVVNSSTGAIAQAISYDEFGRVLSDTAPGFQPFGFAGGLYDSDTKLVTFGARTYDADTGRWLSKDPISFAGGDTNLYGYVMNDPINLFDPSGLRPPNYIPFRTEIFTNNMETARDMTAIEFAAAVRSGGPWDYKKYGRRYEDLGNYNYGLTGTAFGFPAGILQRAAGGYQLWEGHSKPQWGNPFSGPPYGDDPRDQTQINEGISDCKNGYFGN